MTVYQPVSARRPWAKPRLADAWRKARSAIDRARGGVVRARSTGLQVAAFAAFTVAGWLISAVLGLVVLGAVLLILEWLTRGDA